MSKGKEQLLESDNEKPVKELSLITAFIPIVVLILLLSWNVFVFGDDALAGSSQIIIMAVALLTSVWGMFRGIGWEYQQRRMVDTVGAAMPSIIILLLVGSLASIWLLCGTVPVLIFYGLQVLNPAIFLFACTIICAITSVMSGSSWSTAATIGVAMVGIGTALEIPEGLIGGAIISGSYFGDKLSPLSDTTNLASAVTETPLFEHVHYMLYTTGPSMLISATLFAIIGFNLETSGGVDVSEVLYAIDNTFNITIWLLFPPVLVLTLIVKRVSAVPSLFGGIVAGILCVVVFQTDLLASMKSDFGSQPIYRLLVTTLYGGIQIKTENAMLYELFSASGMAGMLNTVWLIIAAMIFSGAIEACGILTRIMTSVKSLVGSFFSLVSCTAATCMVVNVSTSDQYIAVAIPGRMYAGLYKDMGYESKNLSRTLEDTGTVTSVLIPWNTCGAYHAAVLGIGTFTYLPYCFFNMLSPLMTLLFAYAKIKIAKIAG